MRVFISLLLTLLSTNAQAEGAYLVGDFGVIHDRRGVLQSIFTPTVRVVDPVIEQTKTDGKMEVNSCVSYDGGECLPAEESGFFSIVSSVEVEVVKSNVKSKDI